MLGIRREDKNEWERRAPLTPDHVAELVQRGLAIAVQPSAKRAFDDVDYLHSGATIDPSLAACNVVLGVKEIPIELLEASKRYVFFSHTGKGQPANMPLLRRLLELRCTLIDYEYIVDDEGRRVIFFGRHAGYAGMLDSLWALGQRLDAEGLETPFERVRLAHDYSSLDEATHHVSRIGERLRHTGIPPQLHPLVCGFTGSGNVTRGAQEILDRLPSLEVRPQELDGLFEDPHRPQNVVYRVQFDRRHRFGHRQGGTFDAVEFDEHPERYENRMGEWLDRLTLLIHGAYWKPGQPRVVERETLRSRWRTDMRLRVIGDISCDIRGGIEVTLRPTTPAAPVFVYDVAGDRAIEGCTGEGPVVMAVDNLPCQLPTESSEHFGDALLGFIPQLVGCPWERAFDELPLAPQIKRAIIAHRGELTPAFSHLAESIR